MATKKRATKGRSVRGGKRFVGPFLTSPSWGWREVEVTLGEPKPLPESRPEIISKIIDRLNRDGPFRQQYSNGEFVTSSLAIARTFEEAKAVPTLDTSSYTVHYDAALNVYWRRTGSFD